MIARLFLIAMLFVALFLLFLVVSYYGFQVAPDLNIQQAFSGNSDSICEEMHEILSSNDISYAKTIRTISDRTELSTLGLTPNDVSVIEQCLHGSLPTLGSTLVSTKIGFFEGLNGHESKGKSTVVIIENDEYLRLEHFEIGYDPKSGNDFKIPELHVYLGTGNVNSPEIYLDKLKTKLGSKNYAIPDIDLDVYHTVVIYDEIHKEPYAKIKLQNSFLPVDTLMGYADEIKSVPLPKIESSILEEKYGFFDGYEDSKAKGSVEIDYLEDEGTLQINNFEISEGKDLRLYLTQDGLVTKSGYWTFDSAGNLYVSSSNTNQVLRYSQDGTFVDVFVSANSGGLSGPKDLAFDSAGNLYVSSSNTNQVLRYSQDGTFEDVFVSANSGGLSGPKDLMFGPDGHLYVNSNDNRILRFDGQTGIFLDSFIDSDGRSDLDGPTGFTFDSAGNLYVSSSNTNQVLRYSQDGTFEDVFVSANSGGLSGPKDLAFSSDHEHLFVTSFLTDEILRYDASDGAFIDDLISSHDGEIIGPNYAHFGPDGHLYVNSNDNRILRFDGQTGIFLDSFIDSDGRSDLDGPTGFTFDSAGNLYVSSSNTNQVLRYSQDGTFVDVFVSANSGGLSGPKDLAFDSAGNLYVSSSNTNQVLRYSQDGTFEDVFVDSVKTPNGLAFDSSGMLYVASSDSDEVILFDGDSGIFIDVFASGGGLHVPFDLAFDSAGNLYVSSSNTNQVLRYSQDGTFVDVFVDSNSVKAPRGLAFGPDGRLYVVSHDASEVIQVSNIADSRSESLPFVSDRSPDLYQPKTLGIHDEKICASNYFTNDVHCYDEKTGKYRGLLAKSFNYGLVARDNSIFGPDGELYVPNNLNGEISKHDSLTGFFSEVVIKTGTDTLRGPSNLAFGPDGSLYVASDDKIFRFNGTNGHFIDVFITKNKSGLDNPQGLSFDDSFIYVSSYDNNRILQYAIGDGTFESEFVPSRDRGLFGPVGTVVDENTGVFYVTSSGGNRIFKYDLNTGSFLNLIDLHSAPHDLISGPNNTLFVSFIGSEKEKGEVGLYDLSNEKYSTLLSEEHGLSAPHGLSYDPQNEILYISSNKNHKIFAYDVSAQTYDALIPSEGDGILQHPQGLVLKDNNLYVANSANNEILKYSLDLHTLDVFIRDFSDSMRPGGISFGPDQNLYVINEVDNNIYRYDVEKSGLIDIFTNFDTAETKFALDQTHIPLRNIIFTYDGRHLFATSPATNQLFTYDAATGELIENFFENSSMLKYPTELALSPDGRYVLVSNYGENTVLRFTTLGQFSDVFLTPGQDGLGSIEKILYGQDGHLYLMGNDPNNLFKYDGDTGTFLGNYDVGSHYLGRLNENLLASKYLLNDVDTEKNDVVVVYDQFSETLYATIDLYDTVDVITPITSMANSFVSAFNVISEPKIQSKDFVKNTGFLIGLNDYDVFGQVKSKSIDHSSLITIENFFIQYDKSAYVSTESGNILTSGPDLIACLISSGSDSTCNDSDNSKELGDLKINAGDNNFLVHNVDLNQYDQIMIYDNISEDAVANIPLRDYGILRISGESFMDWLQHYFPIFPLVSLIVIIFPVFFDYIRTALKTIFFAFHFLHKKSKRLGIGMHYNPKITILIPAHNEEYGIQKSIETALNTDYPNKEIIVIDDGSKDNTFHIANSFAERGLIKLVHRDTASGSKATALNYGKNYATGDYVLCMDGDTLLDKNALKNAAKHLSDKDVVALSGNVRILSGDDGVDNLLTRLQTYEYMIAIELGRRFTSFFQILLVISGAFGIFKKSSFTDVYTFDKDTLTEDFDLTLKLRKTKGKIHFVGDSIAYTYCPNNWKTWVSQRNRWAYGQLQTLSKNKNILTSKFPFKDKISFFDMFLLDVILSMLFPIGLAVLGLIVVIMIISDSLHILVYSLTFVMLLFMLSELVIFLFAVLYSGQRSFVRLAYLVPIMTFVYRPYLKMINLRAYLRAYFGKKSSWS